MFHFPFGTMHELNLDWFLQQWQQLRQDWIDEEQNIENSMQDVYDARDAAIQAKDDAVSAKNDAQTAKNAADADALKAEGFAVGEQNGTPAGPGDPYYQSNAKYYSIESGTYRYLSEAYARGTMGGTPVDPGDAGYEDNAKYYKDAAAASAQDASDDADYVRDHVTDADASALEAEGFAVGEQNGTPVTSGSPYYQNNAKYYAGETQQDKEDADTFKAAAQTAALKSEGFAVGEQNGTPVASGSPYYENNAKYYSDLAAYLALDAFPHDIAEGIIASFQDGGSGLPVRDLVVNVKAVQSGSGDPTPLNVRPIIGWTEANVMSCGENLLTMDKTKWGQFAVSTTPGYLNNNTRFAPNGYNIPFEVGKTYIIDLCQGLWNTTFYVCIGEYNSSNQRIVDHGWQPLPYTFTVDAQTAIINISFKDSSNSDTAKYVSAIGSNMFIAMAEIAPSTYEIEFPVAAGTVYGGILDVTNGKLTVNHAIIDMGSLTYTYQAAYTRFMASVPDLKPTGDSHVNGNALCTIYRCLSVYDFDAATADTNIMCINNTGTYIYTRDIRYTDAATYATALAGVKLVYEIDTPIEYTFTGEEITTLLGYNNIFADNGDISVDYRADTTLYIQKYIAALQALILENG